MNISANFTAAPLSGGAPLDVQFTDTTPGMPTMWNWSFGGDNTLLYAGTIITISGGIV